MMSSQRFSTNLVNSNVVRACAVLGARFGSCEDGPPNLLYTIFAVLLLVVERWQFRVAYPSASTRLEKLWFMFFVEVLDFFTDGQQIAQAHMCDSDFHDSWEKSVDQAHSPVVYVVGAAYMWRIFAVCQVLAVGLCLPDRDPLVAPCIFVVLQRAVDNDLEEDLKGVSQLFRAVGVGLPKKLPGLILQPSLFALTFAHTEAGQHKQLLSLAVLWATAVKFAVEVALFIAKKWKEFLPRGEDEAFQLVCKLVCIGLSAVFVVGVLVTISVGMLRVEL